MAGEKADYGACAAFQTSLRMDPRTGLDRPTADIPGCSEAAAEKFAAADIRTVGDVMAQFKLFLAGIRRPSPQRILDDFYLWTQDTAGLSAEDANAFVYAVAGLAKIREAWSWDRTVPESCQHFMRKPSRAVAFEAFNRPRRRQELALFPPSDGEQVDGPTSDIPGCCEAHAEKFAAADVRTVGDVLSQFTRLLQRPSENELTK